jgi:2-methylisocitrate lyase-like PEP mutase family enzyme
VIAARWTAYGSRVAKAALDRERTEDRTSGIRWCMSTTSVRRAMFRRLHETGCFVIPNPWDIGTSRYLKMLGFPALATTSAGFGFSRGLPDSVAVFSREAVLAHVAEIVDATDLPVNADFQSGYGGTPEEVAESVRMCVEAGVAGLSIEDATGDPDRPLYELPEALDRLRAARVAIDASGTGVMLTARAECFLTGHPEPLRESLRRLEAYAGVGADVLFAPGPRTPEDIREIVRCAGPKPVNVLVSSHTTLRVADLAETGVRRVSVGSALARAAWAGFVNAVGPLAESGSFVNFDRLTPFAELNSVFRERPR